MKEHIINSFALFGMAIAGLIIGTIIACAIEGFKEKRKRKCSICGQSHKFGDSYCSNCGNRLGR